MLLFLAGLFWGTGMQPHEEKSVEYVSEVYDSPEEIPEPEVLIVDSYGIEYELANKTIETIRATGRKEKISSEIIYEEVGSEAVIPETADIKVWDEESNQSFQTELPLSATRYYDERWKDDFSFSITLHTYGADIYRLGEHEIPKGEDGGLPELESCANDILALIGLSNADYQIEEYQWSGEPYIDDNGVLCRDVKASGIRRISDCAALYEGMISMPDYDQYRLKTNYIRKPEAAIELRIATPSDSLRTLTAIEQETDSLWDKVITIAKFCLQLSVGLGCILLAYIGLRFLLALARKADKKRKDKKNKD